MTTTQPVFVRLPDTNTQSSRSATLYKEDYYGTTYKLEVTRNKVTTAYTVEVLDMSNGLTLAVGRLPESGFGEVEEIYETCVGPDRKLCKCDCKGFQCRKQCVHVDGLHAMFNKGAFR